MHFARAIRLLLSLGTALVVVWSFVDVGARAIQRHESSGQITLRVLHWGDQQETGIMQALIDDFQRENPSIRIQRVHSPSGDDYTTKLKTMFASGSPPDLFYLPVESFAQYMNLDLIHPIDQLLEREKAAGRLDWFDDFYPTLLDCFRWDGAKVGTGGLYGLPKDFTDAVMYVNVDLFRKAGLKVPYDGWSWDEFEDVCRKITALSQTENRQIYGAVLETQWVVLRSMMWTTGGDVFGPGGATDLRLAEPNSLKPLEMIRRMRFQEHTAYSVTMADTATVGEEGLKAFFTGSVGVHGPTGRWRTPRYRAIPQRAPGDTDPAHFEWDTVPMPHGVQSASLLYTNAWAMPRGAPHPEESFRLMLYLCGPSGQALAAKLGLAVPSLKSVANSDAFLNPGLPPNNGKAFLEAIPNMRLGLLPRQAEFFRIIQQELDQATTQGSQTSEQAVARIESRWKQQLASPLKTQSYPRMRWGLIGAITAAAATLLLTLLWTRARREKLGAIDRRTERAGWLFIAPWLIGFLALTLGPMIVSLLLSFSRWTAMTPFSQAEFVGLENYRFASVDPTFYQSLKVTAYYVLLAVPIGQLASLGVALLMNSRIRGITVFRTIYFLPSVISGVALATLWLWMFNNNYGLMNAVLRKLGISAPDWFGTGANQWAIPAFVMMSLWGVGSGMIIYLAGLKGIPDSLYEAATIDGAGSLRRFWNVTLPMLSPLIFYNLVMAIIGSFQVFTQAKVMTNGGPGTATLFYVLNLFREAFELHNMGYASALAWVLFLLVLLLTLLVFRGSRKLVYYEGLKT